MHGYDLPGETAQLGNKKHTYMMSVAQLQQHSSGGDVGGPEEKYRSHHQQRFP